VVASISRPLATPGQRSQRVAHEAAALRPPRIAESGAEILRDQRDDRILESFALVVREGQIVGVGADTQLARVEAERQ
jgi:hypothetical protein